MDTAIIDTIDDNIIRELGETASSLTTPITAYIDNAFREIVNWHHWNWISGNDEVLATIKTNMPDHFAETIEYAVLRKIDLLEAKKAWIDLYYNELNEKKKHDMLSLGVAGSVTNTIIAGYRDDIYWNLAMLHHWSWVTDADMELADIKTDIPDDYNNIIKYGILKELDPAGNWLELYQKEIQDKINKDIMTLGIANNVVNRQIGIYRDNTYKNIGATHLWSWMDDNDDTLAEITADIPNHFHEMVAYGILQELDPAGNWKKMYRDELYEKIRLDVLALGTAASVVNTIIARYRDDVFKDIAAYYRWGWLDETPITLTVGAGLNYVEFPSHIEDEITLYQENGARVIEYIPPEEYDRKLSGSDSTGTYADEYTVKKDRIYFYRPLAAGTEVLLTGRIKADQLEDKSISMVGIKTVIPDHFNSILEDGIRMKVDTAGTYGKWADKFWAGLEQKKRGDAKKEAKHIKGIRGAALKSSRIYTSGHGRLRDASVWS